METLTDRERAYFGPRTDKVPGSPEWCWQTIMLMQTRWQQKTLDEARFQELLDELKAYDAGNVVPPEKPYGSIDALLLAEIGCTEQEAKKRFVVEANPKTGPKNNCGQLATMSQHERAITNHISPRTQRRLDYVAGHAPVLLTKVQDGSMSIHRAYKEARGIPATAQKDASETPLMTLHRVWRKVDPEDRLRFLVEMLTPNERRALQLGFEEDEFHA